MKKRAVFAIAVSLAACLAPAAQGPVELGKILVPEDFELGTDIIGKGEMLLTLVDDELGLVYRMEGEDLECSIGIPTDVADGKDDVRPPRIDVKVVREKGVPHIRISAASGLKTYTSLLRCAKEGPPEPLPPEGWNSLDPQVAAEIRALSEALAFLDRHAGTIWPDWTEYQGLEFSLTFPNRTVVVATTKERMPALFRKAPAAMPGGKSLYVDRSREIPGRLDPLMTYQGHGDYNGVNVTLIGKMEAPNGKGEPGPSIPGAITIKVRKGERPPAADPGDGPLDPAGRKAAADAMRFSRMMMYVHEAFHVLQARRLVEADKKGIRKHPGSMDRDFVPTLDFALHSELEGLALEKALAEEDPARALEYFQDFFVARRLKLREMTPGAAAFDSVRTLHEGTATYSGVKMAMLVRDAGPGREATGKGTPVSDALATAGSFIDGETAKSLEKLKGDTMDVHRKPYVYGACWCLLLDRFFPAWKRGLFENDRTLDEVTEASLKLTEADEARIAGRLQKDFDYAEIRDRHARVIKERDDAVASVRDRKGRRYRIDITSAQGSFNIVPRAFVLYKREQIYPRGLQEFTYGSLRLSSGETPMRFAKKALEWIDTDARPGEKGYKVRFDSREGDLLRKVTLTTRGFTMTAGAVRIVEDGDEVRISVCD